MILNDEWIDSHIGGADAILIDPAPCADEPAPAHFS
jgi:hypothetical protein